MQARWNPEERVEHNPLRWMGHRWVRLSVLERVVSLSPMLLVLSAGDHWLADLIFASVIAFGISLAMIARTGVAGFRSKTPIDDDTPDLTQIQVDVLVHRGGVIIGEDWGTLTIVDDWLVYKATEPISP
jgi:hypothetical protein